MTDTKHFFCTSCGKCCFGALPLTVKDAVAYAGLFPLCFLWTPVHKGSIDFKMAKSLGASLVVDGQDIATFIVPTAYLPSTFPCPALIDQKLCGIHREKPSRCKTMPFYPYRDEKFQEEFLKPRAGWECDTSPEAPAVLQGRQMLQRQDFDQEKTDLVEQAPILRHYAEFMLKYSPALAKNLLAASNQKSGRQIVTSLSSFLTAAKRADAKEIAAKQVPVLLNYANQTSSDPKLLEFHHQYRMWSKEMTYLSQRP
jgi:Fe-S-cluster containining protein